MTVEDPSLDVEVAVTAGVGVWVVTSGPEKFQLNIKMLWLRGVFPVIKQLGVEDVGVLLYEVTLVPADEGKGRIL